MNHKDLAEKLLKLFHRDCICEHEEGLILDAFEEVANEEREAAAKIVTENWDLDHKELSKAIRKRGES